MTLAVIVHWLQYAVAAGFALLGLVSLRDWARYRDRSHGWLAIALGLLGVTSLAALLPKQLPGLAPVSLMAFMGSGYALVRFRACFLPLSRRWSLAALSAVVVSTALALLLPQSGGATPHYTPVQTAILYLLLAVWSACVGEPAARFWLASRRRPAVQRARLRALSAGYGGIVGLLVFALVASALAANPSSDAIAVVTQLVALAMVPLLYAGFAPPLWLRSLWRQREEEKTRRATQELLLFAPDIGKLMERVLESATRLVGADAGLVASGDGQVLAARGLSADDAAGLAGRALGSAEPGSGGSARGDRLLVVPIKAEREVATLVVLAGPFTPLFGSDEVDRLAVYASLVAQAMSRVRLVEDLAHHTEQVRALNEELELHVAERTASNRELEAFVYTVSHDLRAPLRAIDGFVAALMEDYYAELPDGAREFLDDVAANARQMGQLIDDLLAFSRLNRELPKRHEVQPGEIATHVMEQLKPDLADRKVDVVIEKLPSCSADPRLLTQVYTNLLSNAVKYTRRRDKAEIRVGHRTDAGGVAYFVSDNGVGFDPAYADKLFGVFQRLHSSEEYEGTGVGLAIVQRIIQRHGGEVWAESAVDQGATFFFKLQGTETGDRK